MFSPDNYKIIPDVSKAKRPKTGKYGFLRQEGIALKSHIGI